MVLHPQCIHEYPALHPLASPFIPALSQGFFLCDNILKKSIVVILMQDQINGWLGGTAGIMIAYMFPDASPSVFMGALAGTALYVVTSEPHPIIKQIILSAFSFIAGLLSASAITLFLTGVINEITRKLHPPIFINVDPFFGSAIASGLAVTVFLHFLKKWRKDDDDN